MKKYLITLALVIISNSLFSQGLEAANKLNVRMIAISQVNEFDDLNDAEKSNIIGSPYATKEFKKGLIFEKGKLIESRLLLRYNIFSDEIEIKLDRDSDEYSALIKNQDYSIVIDLNTYVSIPYEGSEKKGNYFNFLAEGKHFSLYKKSKVKFEPAKFGKTSYEKDKKAEFITTNTYYLVSNEGTFYELPKSKSKFYKIFKGKEKEMKSFAKKAKINIKIEKDLKRLIKYYNAILN